jgi:hypothetical protein
MSHLRQRTSDQPMASHMHVTSTAYIVPLDNFTGMTSNVVIVSDQLLVGSHIILSLQLASSTMVLEVTHVFVESAVITQAPIGTPLPLRSNPSLPPGYHALNTSITNPSQNPSIANPTQNPSRGPNPFFPPGYNVASIFVPTPTQVLSGGPNIPPPPSSGGSNHLGPNSSNQFGGTSHSVASGFQIPVGGQPQVGGESQVGGQPQVGGNLKLGVITQCTGNIPLYYSLNLGIFLSKAINNRLGGNLLKLIILYPLISGNHM